MKNELDSRLVLRVFDIMRQHGKKLEDQYQLGGLVGSTDIDGYNLYIEDAKVKLHYGFHNQYHFDYSSQNDLDDFIKKLKHIDAEYSA
jgi:hypothetical protein